MGVLAFWLFAQTTLNISPLMAQDLGVQQSLMNIAVSITALFSGIFIVVMGGLATRRIGLGEGGERYDAEAGRPEPPPPMRRVDVADIGDAGIVVAFGGVGMPSVASPPTANEPRKLRKTRFRCQAT